ncbi:AAA family ATPase [Deinococcus apachensis]|uniref:AAA family ATPase n=1 Tax=Deinococcus apachensis TaxID=309886 RepID=UPI0003655297|nr:AAA family ATPase [Deinococcus apachensis]
MAGPPLAADPLAEEAVRAYLRCAARAGQRDRGLRVFGRFRLGLRQEMGLEPEAATVRLHAALLEASPTAVAPVPRPRRASGTPFFGREEELESLGAHLARPDHRLLTLSGPGGAGKTRLAREALEGARETFGAAAHFVPLEAADSAAALVSAMAAATGLKLGGAQPPLGQLLAFLGSGRHLLVLDNFEQPGVREETLAAVLALLEGTGGVTLLVTSRRRLGLQAEWVMALGGLAYPGHPDLAAAARSSAVRLFVERAGRVRPGFALGGGNVASLVEICQLCGGLPLALELSAAWAGSLSAPES